MMILIYLQVFSQQKIYVNVAGPGEQIYSVDLTTCTAQPVGPSGNVFLDIAVTSDGRLWGISNFGNLHNIDTLSGTSTLVGNTGHYADALVELNDSTLLMIGGTYNDSLFKVNIANASTTFIGNIGYSSAGDLIWYDNDLYLVVASGGLLIKIELNSTNTAIVSSAAVNTTANPLPICWGAITAPFKSDINEIVGFKGQDAYKICPFDASYQMLCASIIPVGPDQIYGAASVRLPIQNPVPTICKNITSINESSQSQSFEIYPNPFSTQTTLQANNLLHNATLTVSNCFGQTVKQIKNIFGQSVVLLRGNLPIGLYFIRITQDNKTVLADKFVIADY